MHEIRRRFHEELRALEGEVQQTGTEAQLLLERALQALAHSDPAICDEVIRGDDEVDQLYLDVERRILHLFALQTPVASDLRLLTALLHINLHLERIADQAVNMAKITKLADGLPTQSEGAAAPWGDGRDRAWDGGGGDARACAPRSRTHAEPPRDGRSP
jgi:phosphate transport system protein